MAAVFQMWTQTFEKLIESPQIRYRITPSILIRFLIFLENLLPSYSTLVTLLSQIPSTIRDANTFTELVSDILEREVYDKQMIATGLWEWKHHLEAINETMQPEGLFLFLTLFAPCIMPPIWPCISPLDQSLIDKQLDKVYRNRIGSVLLALPPHPLIHLSCFF